ncbi:hypothetical protein Anapl_00197 [Anas platyrhynchos]|uniref:Uncharacterized protein n=1 Tax=Anas platyrhynchos TaxID=8839 RepID=R0K393_ANAPL|nr:hypothetical protein Anapl_00197 [Anas platyrhynchos]
MRTCTLQQELDLLPTQPAHVSAVRWVLQPLIAVPEGSVLGGLLAAAPPLGSSSHWAPTYGKWLQALCFQASFSKTYQVAQNVVYCFCKLEVNRQPASSYRSPLQNLDVKTQLGFVQSPQWPPEPQPAQEEALLVLYGLGAAPMPGHSSLV